MTIEAGSPVRGIATSGWRGRSFSLGIADAATVLAPSASAADAAATVIGNAVDVADPRIVRRPANEVRDDSDLGDRLVTCAVPPLPAAAVEAALAAGARAARAEIARGRIIAAVLSLQGRFVVVEDDAMRSRRRRCRASTLCQGARPMLIPATPRLPAVDVRKLVVSVEDVWHDNGPRLKTPLRRGWCAAAV